MTNRYEALLSEARDNITKYEAQVLSLVGTNLTYASVLRELNADTQADLTVHETRFVECVRDFVDGLQRPMQLTAVNDFIATLDGMKLVVQFTREENEHLSQMLQALQLDNLANLREDMNIQEMEMQEETKALLSSGPAHSH